MEHDKKPRRNEPVFSRKIRAGRRRTYFFDVRPTRSNDYYLTITESKKRYNEDGYDRHKIFLYKEDFNKFLDAMEESINHVKTELLPEYDFDEFSHKKKDSTASEGKKDVKPDKKEEEDKEDAPSLKNEDVGVEKAPLKEESTPEEADDSPRAEEETEKDESSGEDEDESHKNDSADEDAMKW